MEWEATPCRRLTTAPAGPVRQVVILRMCGTTGRIDVSLVVSTLRFSVWALYSGPEPGARSVCHGRPEARCPTQCRHAASISCCRPGSTPGHIARSGISARDSRTALQTGALALGCARNTEISRWSRTGTPRCVSRTSTGTSAARPAAQDQRRSRRAHAERRAEHRMALIGNPGRCSSDLADLTWRRHGTRAAQAQG